MAIKNKWEKINAVCSILLAITAILAIILSYFAYTSSNNLSKEVIEMTPSKYAYINATLSQWVGDTSFYYVHEFENNKKLERPNQLGLNIVNTGNMNTGQISVSERETRDIFSFNLLQLENIEGGKNNASWLYFNVINETLAEGLYPITLRIYCQNCLEQEREIFVKTKICVLNNSRDFQNQKCYN